MIKILLAINPLNPGRHSRDFASYIARLTGSAVTGVFLENKEVLSIADDPYISSENNDDLFSEDGADYNTVSLVEKNINAFKIACLTRDVRPHLHRDRQTPGAALIKESRFADLMVIDPTISFASGQEGSLSELTTTVLSQAECPIILAGGDTTQVDEIVMAFDGGLECMVAIKQFAFLFPQFRTKKLVVLQVNKTGTWQSTETYYFKEWLKEHFTNVSLEALKGETVAQLSAYLATKENAMLIMGAYGRGYLSRLIKPSHVDMLLSSISVPIFIANT